MSNEISEASVITAGRDVISCALAGGSALLDLRSSVYYGLNEVGSQVWGLIQIPTPVSAIRDALVQRFDVDPDRCHSDLIALLQHLADAGLVTINDAEVS